MTTSTPFVQRLDRITNWLMMGIVIIPFIISAGALTGLARDNGISYPLLYPFMVDGGLVIFKALALQESLQGRRDWYTWAMAIVLTVTSVILNVLHVPATIETLFLARFMAGMPPVVILLAFIAVSRRIEAKTKEETAVFALSHLQTQIRQKETELAKLQETIQQTLAAPVEPPCQPAPKIAHPPEHTAAFFAPLARLPPNPSPELCTQDGEPGPKQVMKDHLLRYVTSSPHATMDEIAQEIGRSKSAVKLYVRELTQAGRLHKNGNGWEVHSL